MKGAARTADLEAEPRHNSRHILQLLAQLLYHPHCYNHTPYPCSLWLRYHFRCEVFAEAYAKQRLSARKGVGFRLEGVGLKLKGAANCSKLESLFWEIRYLRIGMV